MKHVFADTFYFVALTNPRDSAHPKAFAWTEQNKAFMTTTTWVLTEFANQMCQPANRPLFVNFLKRLRINVQVKIFGDEDNLWNDGVELFEKRPDKEWSLTDCLSFVVMEREKLAEALTGDHHFEQAGFIALLK